MRRIALLILLLGPGLASAPAGTPVSAADLSVGALVWQFTRDYPGANGDDVQLPIETVYLKTHDRADWMSTYDTHPLAVSGPEQLGSLVQTYSFQGIDVIAWFVPAGGDIEGQLQRAREVLDTGVKGLYADVEPYAGFCNDDCAYLADNFWARLRQERPNAELGVMYDPRSWSHAGAALDRWLAHSDVALPQCYWETFAGQGVWGDPRNCVFQAHQELATLAPGRDLEYVPILQGVSTPERFRAAMDTALAVGSSRVSIWRRGVTPPEIWSEIERYLGEFTRPCWVTRSDNCVVQEVGGSEVNVLQGGAAFPVPDWGTRAAGFRGSAVHTVPEGFLATLPTAPRDGTLLREEDDPRVYVVYGEAKFWVTSPEEFAALGFEWADVRLVPAGGVAQVPDLPLSYGRFMERGDPTQWVIVRPGRIQIDLGMLSQLLAAGRGQTLYTVPPGALDHIEVNTVLFGDVSCSGGVDSVDALQMLQETARIAHVGLCMRSEGDLNCDGRISAVDALTVLRHVAAMEVASPPGCRLIGSPPGSPPVEPTPPPEPTPEPTMPPPEATPAPSAEPPAGPSPEPTPTPSPGPTGQSRIAPAS